MPEWRPGGDGNVTVSIVREPDDELASVRISLGRTKPRDGDGFYIVFRGEPEAVIDLLELALFAARRALPDGDYVDRRGRPQG